MSEKKLRDRGANSDSRTPSVALTTTVMKQRNWRDKVGERVVRL